MTTTENYPVLIYSNARIETMRQPLRQLRLRKDLLFSSLSVVAGFSIMFLTMLNVLGPSVVLSFIAIALVLAGGIAWLLRVGEVARKL